MARTPVYSTPPADFDTGGYRVAETSLQALMESAPFTEPSMSKDQLLPIMDLAVDALAVLDPREEWIVMARIWRRMSVRQVATELNMSKTHLDRIYKTALGKMRAAMTESGAASDIARAFGTVDL